MWSRAPSCRSPARSPITTSWAPTTREAPEARSSSSEWKRGGSMPICSRAAWRCVFQDRKWVRFCRSRAGQARQGAGNPAGVRLGRGESATAFPASRTRRLQPYQYPGTALAASDGAIRAKPAPAQLEWTYVRNRRVCR
jgi:hypothetical protein